MLYILLACNPNKNTPPSIELISPADGASFEFGELVRFEAKVTDPDQLTATLKAEWTSDLDGVLSDVSPSAAGELIFGSANLSIGNHAITLIVRDDQNTQDSELLLVKIIEAGSNPDDTGGPEPSSEPGSEPSSEPSSESDKDPSIAQGVCAGGGVASDGLMISKSCFGPVKSATGNTMNDGQIQWRPLSNTLQQRQ